MHPFRIEVEQSILDDLKTRLENSRYPDQVQGAGWDYGTEREYLRELCDYWRTDYDWRTHEKELNKLDHFKTKVKGVDLHFIHERSPNEKALPLIITHGWPGSVAEFTKIIGPLSDPESHGGDPEDAFHVVCPSMPGYGFSEAPREPGFGIKSVAQTNIELMKQLGYQRYGVQGGDWGSIASSWVAALDPDHVCGAHLNMVVARRPKDGDPLDGLTPQDLERLEEARTFVAQETAYQRIQGTKPQTLGYGLNDSPVGLAAWILEKFRTWSDCSGDVERRFTKDELLTNIMIYWVTGTITSSMRLYYESMKSRKFGPPNIRVESPTAFAVFPGELTRPPRKWAENTYNVTRWTEMPSGGHFAAMEEPELLIDDIRAFFRDLR